jgi:ketosteroid isomerase-like protein
MSTEENKKIIRQWFDTFNTKDLQALEMLADETWSPDCIFHGGGVIFGKGPAYVKGFVHSVFESTPDAHVEIRDVIAEGDKGACRYTVYGTNNTDGKQEVTEVMLISRFSGGKIADAYQLAVPIQTQVKV